MEQTVFTGIRPLYSSVKGSPNEIEIRIRMRDLIDPSALRMAADMTMKRYPYFCVELQKKNGQYVFADNILKLREAFPGQTIFDRSDVMGVIDIMTSRASDLLKDMAEHGIIEPVAGHGKGKYRFKNRQG